MLVSQTSSGQKTVLVFKDIDYQLAMGKGQELKAGFLL